MRSHVVWGAVVLVAVSGFGVWADERERQPKFSEQAEKTAQALRQAIREEIKTLGKHPWAGEYYAGDGLGMNITLCLAPKAGHVFEWHGCLGLYDRDYGAVGWSEGRLRLSLTFTRNRKSLPIAEEMSLVPWGDREYLIPVGEIVEFCNSVNDGAEPRTTRRGLHLLRVGDEAKAVEGFPAVPEAFKPYLLTRPIDAKITGVVGMTERPSKEKVKVRDVSIILNRGKSDGLLVGMGLHVIEPAYAFGPVYVTKVYASQAEATMTQVGEKEQPRVGWKVSTRWRISGPFRLLRSSG